MFFIMYKKNWYSKSFPVGKSADFEWSFALAEAYQETTQKGKFTVKYKKI